MKFRSNGNNTGEFRGFLGQGTQIIGELHFTDMMRIDGKVVGKVMTSGQLVLGETGELEAEVRVGSLSVSGIIRGNITATEKVEIHKSGKVYGNISTAKLNIEDGAIFEGKCQMSKPESATRSMAAGLDEMSLTESATTN